MRLPSPAALALSGLLLGLVSPARAELLADDFESGTLLKAELPPGRWDNTRTATTTCPSCTIAVKGSAARRGGFGLEVVDNDTAAGSGGGRQTFLVVGNAPTLYGRFWFRVTDTNGAGEVVVAQVRDLTSKALLSYRLQFNTNQVEIGGFNGVGAYVRRQAPFTFAVNEWHLLEFQIKDVGTANGLLRSWIDGQLRAELLNVDYSGVTNNEVTLGEPFADDRLFLGTLVFDDYRLNSAPMASRLAIAPRPEPASAGDCVDLSAGLQSSVDGSGALAPYAVTAALSVGESGSFFSDATCSTPTTTVTIPAGAQSSVVYFRPAAAGTSTLSLAHPDFLDGSAILLVGAPGSNPGQIAGARDGALSDCPTSNPVCADGPLQVGSSCGAAPESGNGTAGWSVALAALLAALPRRRRRR